MPLSEIVIRQAKPGPKAIKIFDGRGLYLLLSPNGARGWGFKYRVDGREKLISFGIYPDVPLKLARDRREEARQQLAAGIDPGAKRKAEKVAQGDTFEAIAREWLALQEPKLAPATFAKGVWTLETLIFPGLGKRPIAKISAPDLLTNADLIAGGLSPLKPELAAIAAARVVLREIDRLASDRANFAFETTLSGLTYLRRMESWQQIGYRIEIVYLRLDSVDLALRRIAARVLQGGHDVARRDVTRRFKRGWENFESIYRPMAESWAIYDNSGASPVLLEQQS